MVNGVKQAAIDVFNLGKAMWSRSPEQGTVAAMFAEFGDFSAVAFELVNSRYPEGMTRDEISAARAAAENGGFRGANDYFRELLEI